MRNTLRIALITMLLVAPMAMAAKSTNHCTEAKGATCCTKSAECCTNKEACCKKGAKCCVKHCKSADGTGCAMRNDGKACDHKGGCTKSCCGEAMAAKSTDHCTAAKGATCCTKSAECCTNKEACCKEGAKCCVKHCKSADGTGCAMKNDGKACDHKGGCTNSCCGETKSS